jgi:hypothetical protein
MGGIIGFKYRQMKCFDWLGKLVLELGLVIRRLRGMDIYYDI